MTPQDNFSKWFVENPVYLGRGEYFEGDEPPNLPFISILGLERDNLKPFTKDVLEHLEDNEELHDFKTGDNIEVISSGMKGSIISKNSSAQIYTLSSHPDIYIMLCINLKERRKGN